MLAEKFDMVVYKYLEEFGLSAADLEERMNEPDYRVIINYIHQHALEAAGDVKSKCKKLDEDCTKKMNEKYTSTARLLSGTLCSRLKRPGAAAKCHKEMSKPFVIRSK
jgi:hypothetical protein